MGVAATPRANATLGAREGGAITTRVLVVEDDPDLRAVFTEALADEGFEVRSAAEGREALGLLRQAGPQPCIVLLDLRMPGMSGWELAAHMRRSPTLEHIPIVVVAAHYLIAEEARRIGATAWLQKPVSLTSLVAAVNQVCAEMPEGGA